MGMYPPPLTDPHEIARLRHLADTASAELQTAVKRYNGTQVETSTESTQFFEKLAIGSGATIAALVSFFGAQHATLHPHWILRIALASLAVVLGAALYRNFRYPYYKLAVNHRLWLEAYREERKHRNNYYQYETNAIDNDTGQPFDLAAWTKGFNRKNDEITSSIQFQRDEEDHWWWQCKWAGHLCLIAVASAFLALVVLAFCNF
jgi:hypothetical protein